MRQTRSPTEQIYNGTIRVFAIVTLVERFSHSSIICINLTPQNDLGDDKDNAH
jgi:hypothetical protein